MRQSVLIADGDPRFVWTGQQVLGAATGRHFDVRATDDGGEALHLLTAAPPAVAFLGVDLPERGGIEIIRTLARTRPFRDTRFVAVVARQDEATFAALEAAGAAGYLPKPVTQDAFLGTVIDLATLRDAGETVDVLLAPPDRQTELRRHLEVLTRSTVIATAQLDFVAALAGVRPARVRAVFVAEPGERMSTPAAFEFLRSAGAGAAVVSIGAPKVDHPGVFRVAPELSRGEMAGLLDKLARIAPGRPRNASDRALRPKPWLNARPHAAPRASGDSLAAAA